MPSLWPVAVPLEQRNRPGSMNFGAVKPPRNLLQANDLTRKVYVRKRVWQRWRRCHYRTLNNDHPPFPTWLDDP